MFTLATLSDGNVRTPVADFESQHSQTARAAARRTAKAEDVRVLVMAADVPRYVVNPDGTQSAPPGVKATACKRASGASCFCTACRAERAASRVRA
jgi:hypothetical protein